MNKETLSFINKLAEELWKQKDNNPSTSDQNILNNLCNELISSTKDYALSKKELISELRAIEINTYLTLVKTNYFNKKDDLKEYIITKIEYILKETDEYYAYVIIKYSKIPKGKFSENIEIIDKKNITKELKIINKSNTINLKEFSIAKIKFKLKFKNQPIHHNLLYAIDDYINILSYIIPIHITMHELIYIIYNPDNTINFTNINTHNRNNILPAPFNKEYKILYKKFKYFYNDFLKDKNNDLKKRILRSIKIYNYKNIIKPIYSEFDGFEFHLIIIITALESLLLLTNENRFNACEKVLFLLGKNKDEKIHYQDITNKFYLLRNKLIHEGISGIKKKHHIDQIEIQQLNYEIFRPTLEKILKLQIKFNTIEYKENSPNEYKEKSLNYYINSLKYK